MYNVDCMQFMAECKDKQFDLAIVDPPYGGNDAIGRKDCKNINKQATQRTDYKLFENKEPSVEYWNQLFRISKNQIIWGGNYFELPCSQYFVIWDKGETMYGRDFAECEYAWVRNGGTRIFKKSPNQPDRIHPTQKPVDLYKWLLKNYAKEGDRILDTHGGSGSICIACHDEGFDLDWCELDKDYFNAAKKRLETHQKQIRMF